MKKRKSLLSKVRSKVLLVDVDSKIPNLALMKLATYYKGQGCIVDTKKLDIPFNIFRRKHRIINAGDYDKVFISAVFRDTKDFVEVTNHKHTEVVWGGTGFSLKVNLPDEIENLECDYSIYPGNEISYGFITRGCIRNCYFCVVPKKEGRIRQVATIDDIVRHKKVKFLDNNILAWKGHKEVFRELVRRQLRCEFNQGLDIRLIDEENAGLLADMNYSNEYIFAFDNIKDEKIITKKFDLITKNRKFFVKGQKTRTKLKFFIYCHPDMDFKNDFFYRVMWCRNRITLPYIMKDMACWTSPNSDLYTSVAAWGNTPGNYFKMTVYQHTKKYASFTTYQKLVDLLGKENENDISEFNI